MGPGAGPGGGGAAAVLPLSGWVVSLPAGGSPLPRLGFANRVPVPVRLPAGVAAALGSPGPGPAGGAAVRQRRRGHLGGDSFPGRALSPRGRGGCRLAGAAPRAAPLPAPAAGAGPPAAGLPGVPPPYGGRLPPGAGALFGLSPPRGPGGGHPLGPGGQRLDGLHPGHFGGGTHFAGAAGEPAGLLRRAVPRPPPGTVGGLFLPARGAAGHPGGV